LIGLDLAGQLKREESSLKVISSSGYGPDRASAARTAGQEITIFPKPYKVAALAQTVRGCLDHP